MILRVIPYITAPGRMQMAIDQWLLEQYLAGQTPPVLRFYTWSEPTISLGYHQRKYPSHWDQLTWRRQLVPLVRRPTGGRAVLHTGDLTYSLVMTQQGQSHRDDYCYLCRFLVQGWRSLGLELHLGGQSRNYQHTASCFSSSTIADLTTTAGEKFIGSAQLRRSGAILQHGSMLINLDQQLYQQVFQSPPPQPAVPSLDIDTIAEALIRAAQTCFKLEPQLQPLSEVEWQGIQSRLTRESVECH